MNSYLTYFLASFLIWVMYAGLVVLWFIDGKIKKEQVMHAILAIFVAWTTTEILKRVFNIPRPYVINGLPTFTVMVPGDPAFPSGHSATVFALAVTIWLHDKKVGILFLIGALLVAWARVAANVHYPIDVFVGSLIGVVVAVVIERVHLRN